MPSPEPPTAASATRPRPRRRLPLWKKLLFSAVIVAGPFLLLEGCLRLFFPQLIWTDLQGGVVATDDAPWGLIPSREWRMTGPEFGTVTIRTNRDGIVDRVEHTVEKPPGTVRILFLGDSFSEGWGLPYEQRFDRIVERALQDRFGPQRIEVIKAGIRGFDMSDVLIALETKWTAYQPDIVLVGFLLNDIVSIAPYDPHATAEQRLEITKSRRRRIGGGRLERFTTSLHIFGFVRRLLFAQDAIYTSVYFTWREGHQYFRAPLEPRYEQRYDIAVAWLAQIASVVRAAGGELHIMFFPQRIQVLLTQKPVAGVDPYRLPRVLGEKLRAAGVASHDLLPALAVYPPTFTHFTADGHFSPGGASVVARELLVYLLTRTSPLQALVAAEFGTQHDAE